ncbi:uncharacterized protein F5147DRAFT_700840 [Suillus discolor]|uniref:F-box domain-containing protein n=1 Tax=Suillus discolor TaxID=1912936 RepID=A0A9P7F4J6_9AGAM|nr:uncharacterized protein F5147DRAFT_700840 [Suillus discolor]KAG2106624.1 hypothetical protein F5147DRAFT_700840 [Suillus discolor]
MNQVRHATLELLDLPVEILVYIFSHLDGYELARAHQVCHNIRHMIDSSSELLYPIDLKYFNSIPVPSPGPDHTVASLRESLRQSEFAWQKAEYFKSNPVSIPYTYITHDVFMWSGGILALDVQDENRLRFLQPQVTDPDHSNSTSLREWDYHFDGEFPLCDFSPIQDLLICLVKASPGESHACDLIFRSLSEPDEVHPEAGSAVVKTIDEEVDFESLDPSTVSFSIFGNYCGILFSEVLNEDGDLVEILQIWNWKSKDVSLCLKPAHEILHFTFLTNETILVVNSEELLLYSLVDFPNALHLTAKFSLPALPTSCRYEEIRIKDSISSHSRMHDHIININMKILGDRDSVPSSCVALYVERNTLLELQSTYTRQYGKASDSSPNLPWSEWGLKYTRSFRGDLLDTCKNVVFGLRAVSFVGSQIRHPLPRALCIRDFNPHRVADFKAGNGIRWNQRLIEGNLLDSCPDMFLEPLGSGLPYIETITEEKFIGVDLIAEGNKVMVLSFDFVGRLKSPRIPDDPYIVQNEPVSKSIEILNFE